MSTLDRFRSKYHIDPVTNCWEWAAYIHPDGYGFFWYVDRTTWAHRVSYELHVGPIPEGLQIDHLCRNRACVNPEHLEPVTQAENLRRGSDARTHCKHGHELTPENTRCVVGPRGRRRACRACEREASRRFQSRKRSLAVSA